MRPRRRRLRPGSMAVRALAGAVLAFLVCPVFVVLPLSFSSASFLQFPPPGFSLQWYRAYFESHQWLDATWTSLQVATAAAILATLLGVPAAFALVRGRFRGRAALEILLAAPLVVPVIIIALALYFFYAPLHLVGTRLGLILAHTLLAIPFVTIIVSANLRTFDIWLERAAMSLGAGPLRTFTRVTLPVLRPGILSAALFAFITSFDEVVIAIFVAGTRSATLPKVMFDGIREEISPTISAVSTLLIGASFLLFLGVLGLQRRQARTLAGPGGEAA